MRIVSRILFSVSLSMLACSGPSPQTPVQEPKVEHSPPSESSPTAAPTTNDDPREPTASTPAESEKRGPMNVILLVIDAMRWDMPWNGYSRAIAPNLTRLAEKSVRFERGYAISSYTSKSVAGLLSGRFPSEMARTSPFFTKYDDSNEMMAEVLQRRGVRTVSAHAHMYLDKPSGLTQGFDVWRLISGIQFDYNKDPYITSPQYTDLVKSILEAPENTSGRFFGYFHYMDPHHEYNTHKEAPTWGTTSRDLYDEEIWFTDKWVGELLTFIESRPWAKNTAIIVTGDHGEGFGERVGGVDNYRIWKHAFELYEVLIKVPLFVYVPGVEARQIARWRGHIDLVPTIFDLLGEQPPEGLSGVSLVPEIKGEDVPPRPIIVDLPADTHNRRRRALIEDGYKLIAFGKDFRFTLYNVKDDPGESKELSRVEPERKKAMVERYRGIVAGIHDVKAVGAPVLDD
ncbi:MAG TPA: sulfatase [Polyangiaceae bacterium]|nr:sulfatase [Polyangiaceae bacterium]